VGEIVQMTEEQLERLLGAARGPEGKGLGAPLPQFHVGLGCGPGPIGADVLAMLAAGSPRLALAKAWGVPLAPYLINVRATFPDVDTTDVPDVGSDVKIVQDTLIDGLVIRITNDNTPQNVFQPQSDYFFNFQSGLEATLDVQGAPRYGVAPKFTPLSTLADVVNGNAKWPAGWILTYQQQLFMSFHSRVSPLPFSPLTVVCTYRGWVPVGEMFVQMTNREAFIRLAECGIVCDKAYVDRWCR
jgi:hypothetical protein